MCGIAGLLDPERRSGTEELEELARIMGRAVDHRGPDGNGIWVDAEAGLAFAHTRLSIVDLSPAGAQPMVSSCGRFVLTYNGEVYNGGDLRPELEARGRRFRGHSDTEVMVEGFAEWGVRPTIERLIGMFAFAAFDRRDRKLFLARDRLGIKPLYVGRQDGRVLFASELKAMEALPFWQGALDPAALAAYLRHACVPAPRTIYRGVQKLEPGRILTIAADGTSSQEAFWSLADAVARARAEPLLEDEEDAVERLEALLMDAVGKRLMADVPLGAFLSGGIDSSTVAALMRKTATGAVRTYSIGFGEVGFDEAPHARAVARHIGTEHTELYVSSEEALAAIPEMPKIYDEPFADSSQVPTYLLSRLTRRHVTVALSGDGGDELFAGYNRHRAARALDLVPPAAGSAIARAIRLAGPAVWDRAFGIVPDRLRPRLIGDKLYKVADVLDHGRENAYRRLVSQSPGPETLLMDPVGITDTEAAVPPALVTHPAERMQYLDTIGYLPDDILTKVDRASMAVALEVRVPLLDHRVVEFSWRLPARLKLRGGRGKHLLRRVLYRHVPRSLVERPKAGFGVPLAAWLRGPLRSWAEELLEEPRLAANGLLDPVPIRQAWSEHLSGSRNLSAGLWTVLMFQAWRAERGF